MHFNIWDKINGILEKEEYKTVNEIIKESTKLVKQFNKIIYRIKVNVGKCLKYTSDDF
ncbi:hypothetical protein [Romboutsia sp. 1001216sp1]|uniref:hypothetical protein n=1 Tax=Romboutsia sp. 1001216sp1 TaxID=2986997 RepID=UPI00232CF051|nr:hypothetical protein [Romboutsia sp. 1001216sp1]MDB8803646.1 hypothetical protein [Romboutsia sp. 1001216sp1]MDB8807852.1 hypothetical protein [Romboutsia sp. 1001216sp1]MDB8815042.1 hypothetical protein [Romboutsia sp. 1001216sp1]